MKHALWALRSFVILSVLFCLGKREVIVLWWDQWTFSRSVQRPEARPELVVALAAIIGGRAANKLTFEGNVTEFNCSPLPALVGQFDGISMTQIFFLKFGVFVEQKWKRLFSYFICLFLFNFQFLKCNLNASGSCQDPMRDGRQKPTVSYFRNSEFDLINS